MISVMSSEVETSLIVCRSDGERFLDSASLRSK